MARKKRKYGAADLRSNRKNQAKRVELNRIARQRGIYGKRNKMGKDLSHGSDGSVVLESVSSNRSRNGKNGKSSLRSSKREKVGNKSRRQKSKPRRKRS